METQDPNITDIDINKEMREAYLQYSMSVIVGRALPDVRDGLKPVHRRVLFAMRELSNYHNKPYKKSARVVGDVIGKYHPHGDVAAYDTIVRMAQDFSLRYPLVDGQGNFGSVDGDSPAAQRYTEIRMTRLAEQLLEDIEKETVPWANNYDDSLLIPTVLPAKFPNLLVNGSAGIAVGMATNIPPHNLTEVINGCAHLIQNPEATIDELMEYIPGPDLPTGGIIAGQQGIISAYKKGRGIIQIKAVSEIVSEKERNFIIITAIPYQVNKARLIESIASLVRDKRIEGISDVRDESSREGMRVVIALKRNAEPNIVLNRLYKFTQMQVSFGVILLALDKNNQPTTFNLKTALQAFIDHRKDVVTQRCVFDLKKAEARAHILKGLIKALEQIDEIIVLIKASKEAKTALEGLMKKFSFSELQAKAILEMRLQRLTGLEREKINSELVELKKTILWLKDVLGDVSKILKIIIEELQEIKEKFGDNRKTELQKGEKEILDEDLIPREEVIVTMTNTGYIKRIPVEQYRLQKRGGKGLKGAGTREEDFVSTILYVNTMTQLLVFSDRGKVFWQKVYRLPIRNRTTRGQSVANLVQIGTEEKVEVILPVDSFEESSYVVMLTAGGIIKKTSLSAFARPRPSGIIALTISDNDQLIKAGVSSSKDDILLVTQKGMSIRFSEDDVRPTGRSARGVKGITLGKDDVVASMDVIPVDSEDHMIIVTAGGYGKRTPLSEYRKQTRAGRGIITQKVTQKTGLVVAACIVKADDQVMMTTDQGQSIRMKCSDISTVGRNTQGVRLMHLKTGESVTGLTLMSQDEDVEDASK